MLLYPSRDKTKAHAVVGRGDKSMISDPGSELHLEREKKKRKVRKIADGRSKKKKREPVASVVYSGSVVVNLTRYTYAWRQWFNSRYGIFFERHQMPRRALYSVGKHNWMRVDEGRKC